MCYLHGRQISYSLYLVSDLECFKRALTAILSRAWNSLHRNCRWKMTLKNRGNYLRLWQVGKSFFTSPSRPGNARETKKQTQLSSNSTTHLLPTSMQRLRLQTGSWGQYPSRQDFKKHVMLILTSTWMRTTVCIAEHNCIELSIAKGWINRLWMCVQALCEHKQPQGPWRVGLLLFVQPSDLETWWIIPAKWS